ncbi:hypothetical protein AYK26_04025 [Euryarchaeota archaeon SM23-78]|nr:MAG: hypothetical protein AYK26_04025 [Euryarchaeota archaeon SM23-78]MBW3000950.1 glycosyltransferase family 2 protein [Candidatus Woesearchaeota archaeon]
MIQNIIPYFAALFDWEDWIFRKIMCLKDVNGRDIDVSKPPKPYKILMSVYNLENNLEKVIDRLSKHKEHLVLVDDASSDNTVQKARELGIDVIPCVINKHKPQEVRHGLTHLDPSVETVVVMDPDTIFLERYKGKGQTLEEAVSWLQQTGANACAVNMRVKNENLLTKLQDTEYNITMEVGRRALRDDAVVSGGCALFERKTLDIILREHSGSVLAEDYETSIRILRKNGRILYNGNFVVETEGPKTLRSFTKQRIWWDESIIKVLFESLFMKRSPTLSTKRKNKLREFYNHYIYNWGLDVMAHPIKLAGIPFIGMSLANGIEKIIGVDYIPSLVNTPLGHINVGPEVAGIFYGSYVLLSTVNVLLNGLPKKRRYIPAVLTYPFYKVYQITVPRMVGFTKGVGNVLKKLKKKKREFMLPKNYYENYCSNNVKPEVSNIDLRRFFNVKPEQYEMLFYKTPYHDLYLIEFKNMPETLKKYVSNYGEKTFLGIDMEDRFIRVLPFTEAKKYFPRPSYRKIEAEPFKIQEGLICRMPNEEGSFIMYKDFFKDGRETPIYFLKRGKKGAIKSQRVVEAPSMYKKDFLGLENLALSVYPDLMETVSLSLRRGGNGGQSSLYT